MNWGNKLVLVFIIFGGLMATLVYKSVNTKFDLVSNSYYEDELTYQSIINGTSNAKELGSAVNIEAQEEAVSISIPADHLENFDGGNIWFYCVTDADKDIKSAFQPDASGKQIIPKTVLKADRYTVKLQWKSAGKDYYSEKQIRL